MTTRTIAACMLLLMLMAGCTGSVNKGSQVASPANDSSTDRQMIKRAQPIRVSAENTDAAEPVIAAGQDGTIFVAWVEHKEGGKSDLWLAHFNGEGKALRQPLRVNPNMDEVTAWFGGPTALAVAQDGSVYLGWTARAASEGHATTLYLSASHDGGQSFASPVKINDDSKPAVHGMQSLAVAPDGRIYAAWLDERNITGPQPSQKAEGHHMESNREVFISSSTDGGRSFSPNVRVASEVCPCCKTSLAVATNGRLYVSWRQVLPGDFRHIAVASSTDEGRTFSTRVIVSDDRWVLTGCPVSGPALEAGTDNVLRVLWYTAGDAGRSGLYWSESRDGGRTFAPRQLLAGESTRGTPVLIANEGDNFTALWEGNAGDSPRVVAARMTSGTTDAARLIVADKAELPVATIAGDRVFVAYIAKEGDRRSVQLIYAQKSKLYDAAQPEDGSRPENQVVTVTYRGVGIVEAVYPERKTIKLNHEEIKGYMDAMSMEFHLKDPSLLNSVTVGEHVDFTLEESAGIAQVTEIRQR